MDSKNKDKDINISQFVFIDKICCLLFEIWFKFTLIQQDLHITRYVTDMSHTD